MARSIRGWWRGGPSGLALDRRPLVFGCGAAKTGTHSLAAVFRRSYRVEHEAEADALCDLVVDLDTGAATGVDLERYLRERDARLGLEVDASQLNAVTDPVIEALVRLYPTGRFVLTVREPRAWLDSFFDHHLGAVAPPTHGWARLSAHLWGAYPPHSAHDRVLADHGFPSIAGRLQAWRRWIERVEGAVPGERLLVVRTDRFTASLGAIAGFAGVPPDTLDAGASHDFRAAERHGLLAQVDPGYVEDQVQQWCQPVLDRLFPGSGSGS